MKAITIKQPYASLIANGYKTIEIRTWKTSYRGELFIHAGLKEDKKTIFKYESNLGNQLPKGRIIAKCQLIDCILLTKENIDSYNENSLIYKIGYEHIGCYGFVLDKIEIIDPIIVKGKLSIWNF